MDTTPILESFISIFQAMSFALLVYPLIISAMIGFVSIFLVAIYMAVRYYEEGSDWFTQEDSDNDVE